MSEMDQFIERYKHDYLYRKYQGIYITSAGTNRQIQRSVRMQGQYVKVNCFPIV